ncbi:MAG TPA: alpha/beta fold hydrolase [Vicinamibacterales bacterium]|nr:alpha/beta fold hydrolase [Vicinamibacterales bacterium]
MRSINGAITSPAAGIEQPAISRLGALITRSRQQSRLDRRAPGAREHVSFGVDGDAAAADDVERELMGICESLLGVRPGRHDSLFGCGIDSLTALRLTAQCEKRFKCQLPAATLFTAPSVAQLAQVLRERTTAAAWSSLVAFQSRGSRPPFFWIHGDSTAPLLSRYLGPDQPFYGLEHQGQDGRPALYTDVETIAAYYLREMRRVQPNGPYYLGGFSFGGVVALEVAQQLTRQSEHVALLVALDPSSMNPKTPVAPSAISTAADGVVAEGRRHLDNLAALPASKRFAYIWTRALPKMAAWLRWHLLAAGFTRLVYRFQVAMRLPLSVFVRRRYIQDIYLEAIARYTPRPYAGRVLLFKGRESVYQGPRDWEQLVGPDCEVSLIPAGHMEMFKDEHFRAWAEKLADVLHQARRAARRHTAARAASAR